MKPIVCRRLPTFALLLATVLPAGVAGQAPTSPQGIAASLQPFIDKQILAGAVVLVAAKDRVLALETVGYADLAAKKPMHEEDLFWIASMSKPITATAMMMLVDEGKVHLDDPVTKYLPEFNDQWLAVERDKEHMLLRRPAQRMTVRNLLSHTSGLPPTSALEKPTLDLLPLRVAVRSYAMMPLMYEPGSKYQYSNAGINTAGRIIEVMSGMPYEDFLEKRLFAPLGMKDTTFWPNEEQLGRLAKSYKPTKDKKGLEETTVTQLHYPLNDRQRQPMPAGGLFSTAQDLGRFGQMVLNGGIFQGKRYLSAEAVAEMTKRQTNKTIKESYGLGWGTNGDVVGHGGAYSTQLWVDRKKELVQILLVQHAGFPPGEGGKINQAFLQAAAKAFER
jgi:CubicO group peptidase (beta-lactamase class C family)